MPAWTLWVVYGQGVQLESTSEVINRWRTPAAPGGHWHGNSGARRGFPCRLINGAHVQEAPKTKGEKAESHVGPRVISPGPEPASTARAFLGQGPLFTDHSTGRRAGIRLRFSHSLTQAGDGVPSLSRFTPATHTTSGLTRPQRLFGLTNTASSSPLSLCYLVVYLAAALERRVGGSDGRLWNRQCVQSDSGAC